MENSEILKKRGRKIGCNSKWGKLRYHIEIKGIKGENNIVVGDFCSRDEAGKAITDLIGVSINGQNLYDIENGRSKKYIRQILVTHI